MDIQKNLKLIPFLSVISHIGRKYNVNVWLVGGFLRDIYLKPKKDLADFDFCVEKDVLTVVKEFAGRFSSKFIILDKDVQSYRIVLKKNKDLYTYDFSLIRGKTIEEDLALRDFSINTLAVDLNKKKLEVIDLLGAKQDIAKKIIRVIKEEVLFDDPLRILRGFSFMVNYGFRIETKTLRAMFKFKKFLKGISGERISEELFKMFSSSSSFAAVKKMDQLKIIDEIIPYVKEARGVYQGKYHHLDVWPHSLETLRQFELIYRRIIKEKSIVNDYLNQPLAQGRRLIQVLKLACLLHDIGKPRAKKNKNKKTIFYTHEKIGRDICDEIAQNLRLSAREKEFLKKLVFWHLRPGYLADQKVPSHRAVYRFFRDTGDDGAAVIILSFADWRATRGPLIDMKKRRKHERIMLNLIDNYFAEKSKKPLPIIINGYDVMKRFSLCQGPLVGEVLKAVREAQMLGEIFGKTEAYKIAEKIIKREGGEKNVSEKKS